MTTTENARHAFNPGNPGVNDTCATLLMRDGEGAACGLPRYHAATHLPDRAVAVIASHALSRVEKVGEVWCWSCSCAAIGKNAVQTSQWLAVTSHAAHVAESLANAGRLVSVVHATLVTPERCAHSQ